jgi:polyketide biosynthesis enoyl-CoA hydratase PksI
MSSGPVHVELTGPVATVTLADQDNRNRFTPALRRSLPAALAEAAACDSVSVVVLEGLPDVFCAGVGRDELLGGQEMSNSDGWQLVRSPLECPLPVIAAARGHALGGGLLLALYADLVILGARSGYAANFLSYAFAPCYGATFLVPARLGARLGAEMLYSARPYSGRELAERRPELLVMPNEQVVPAAHRLAERMAKAPRRSLELLKERLAVPLLQGTADAFTAELPGHLETIASDAARHAISVRYPHGRNR